MKRQLRLLDRVELAMSVVGDNWRWFAIGMAVPALVAGLLLR